MKIQPDLFTRNVFGGIEPAEPLAKAVDPPTSHRAAGKQRTTGRANSESEIILAVLRRAARLDL